MDLRRLRVGEWIAAIAGVVLIGSLFLPWYRIEGADGDVATLSAWGALGVLEVVLAALGVLALGVWLLTASRYAASSSIAAETLLMPVAIGVTIACLIRVLDVPTDLSFPISRLAFPAETSTALGGWLGLAGCVGVLAGLLLGMRDERLSKPGRPTDGTGVPAPPPEIETLPGPPRA
jgi:hypothetical protein